MGNGTSALKIGGFSGSTPAPGTGLPVLTGFPLTGNLDLTGNSASVASMVVSSDTSAPNVITVGTGNTFTVTGNVLVGGLQASTIKIRRCKLPGAVISNSAAAPVARSKFGTDRLTAASAPRIGFRRLRCQQLYRRLRQWRIDSDRLLRRQSVWHAHPGAKNNTLIAGRLDIGLNLLSGSTGNRGGGTLQLGASNLIRADIVTVGSGKTVLSTTTVNGTFNGSIMMFKDQAATGQTAVFRAKMVLADWPNSPFPISHFTIRMAVPRCRCGRFHRGKCRRLINSLRIGVGKSGSNNAGSTGTLIFNAGTIDANSVIIAQRAITSGNVR